MKRTMLYDSVSSQVGFTEAQQKALALVPKFTSSLSLLSQIWIMAEVLHSPKKRGSVFHRLLAGLSLAGFFRSCGHFLSTWPIPYNTAFIYANVGTTMSCNVQGFLMQFGLAPPLYISMICVYYWLAILHGWSDRRIKAVELWIHSIPWGFGIATAIVGLVLDLYNPSGFYCWIAPYPTNCERDMATACERGGQAYYFRLGLYYIPLLLGFVGILYCLISVYFGIRHEELQTLKYRQPHLFYSVPGRRSSGDAHVDVASEEVSNPSKRRRTVSEAFRVSLVHGSASILCCGKTVGVRSKSSQVASQCIWYVLAFCTSYFAGAVQSLIECFHAAPFGIVLVRAIVEPLQGVFDFAVYRRPIYLRLRRDNGSMSRWTAAWRVCQWPGIEGLVEKTARPSISEPETEKAPSAAEERKEEEKPTRTEDHLEDEGPKSLSLLDDDDDEIEAMASHRIVRPNPKNTKKIPIKKTSLGKIREDKELSEDEIDLKPDYDPKLDFCLERDRQFTSLSELDIIEDVKDWVSVEVKHKVALNRSLPNLMSGNESGGDLLSPPPLAFHVTM